MNEERIQARARSPVIRYLLALVIPLVSTGIGLAIGEQRTTSAALVYLLGVLPVATVGGAWPGVAASVMSFVGLNFFFTPPLHTLSVGKSDDLVALVVFLTVGLLVAALASRGASERDRAHRREYEARSLYAMSTRLLGAGDLDAVLGDLVGHVRTLFELRACEIVTLDADGRRVSRAIEGAHAEIGRIEIPLPGTKGDLGALILTPGAAGFGEPERRVASILAQQLASSLERATLEAAARVARLATEASRVRQALLSAVSHDFRTPLASIKAALTAIVPGGRRQASLAEEDLVELLRTALEETERLERLVSNLLDLTRLRSGSLAPSKVRLPIQDLLADALSASRRALATLPVDVQVRPDVPEVDVDPVQVGQVLRNVIENAARYAPAGSGVKITAAAWRGAVEVRVIDHGPGIASEEREAVFEEFFRGGDGRSAGTGLGLAIARAIARAHGGDIWVEETPGGGATLAMRLPAAPQAA